MKRIMLKLWVGFQIFLIVPVYSQVLNPNDPIVIYNSKNPPKQPANGQIGKWVITPWATWDTYSYKAYIYKDLPFRIKFPVGFNPNDGKKYPLILMLHGNGEKADDLFDNELQLKWGGIEHRNAIDNGVFNGFAVFPQNQSGSWTPGQLTRICELLDLLIKQVNIDPDRITVHGLSAGGSGVWDIISSHAKYFSAGVPMSSAKSKYLNGLSEYIYMPLWLSQGGKDINPAPSTANYLVNKITAAGGEIRYSLYPDNSHNTWKSMYAEPDFFPFLLRANKTNPHVFYGKTNFCPGEKINVRLGLGKGFEAYEWKKDGISISNASSNEIVVTQPGSYSGRFKRNGVWSAWSAVPVVIKNTSPQVIIETNGSTALPTPAGVTSVTLTAPSGYSSYKWSTGSTSNSIMVNKAGSYTVTVSSSSSCGTTQSSPVVVTVANGSGSPAAPADFGALIKSGTQINLSWQDNANNESSYEIYHSTDQNSGFQLITSLPANSTSFQHNVVSTSFTHYYKLRCINNSGSSGVISTSSTNTLTDTEAPSIPQNLVAISTDSKGVNLTWSASTDNKAVTGYDIYQNGSKVGSTGSTSYSASGLTAGQLYRYQVLAKDAANNKSEKSNQSSAFAGTGHGTPAGPTAPSGLAASTASYQQINLTWQDKSSDESAFEIFRSLSSGGSYEFVGSVNANQTNYSDQGLKANTTYYYKVRAIGNKGESSFIGVASAKTSSAPNPPSAPSNLSASPITNNSIKLHWKDNANNETGYRVKRATPEELPNYTQIAELGSNVVEYENKNLSPHSNYFYQIVAFNIAGESSALSKKFTTSNSIPLLGAVSDLVIDFGVKKEIKITATDDDDDILSFNVTNKPSFVSFIDEGDGTMLLIINPGVGNVGTYKGIKIKVSDENGGSDSKNINLTVNSLAAIGESKTSIFLNWADRQGETGYQIERRLVGGSFSQIGTTSANVTSYVDGGLSQNTRYEYRIKGKGSGSVTNYSNIAVASTFNYMVYLNFNQNNPAASPWNNANRVPQESDNFSNLLKDNKSSSGISVKITQNFDGENPFGMNTGNNSGIVPDNVMRSTYWLDAANTAQLKISGLKQNERYNLVFFASRQDNGQKTNRTTDYTVNGTTVSLNASDNTSIVVKIAEIVPSTLGEAIIDIAPSLNALFGYIGGLIIDGYNAPSNNARTANEVLAKIEVEKDLTNEEEISRAAITRVYPNPFERELRIGVDENYLGEIDITLRNVLGRVVRSEQINLDGNQFDIVLQDLNLTKGIYILTVKNSDGQSSNFRVIKE